MSEGVDETLDAGELSGQRQARPLSFEETTELGSEPSLVSRHSRRHRTEPEKGTLVGRYVVLSRLGAGAMGVVIAAYDPELDRKVAIKLLHSRGGDQMASRARLQREAQALARLNHPHVVSVYDVGIHDDQVFVAMEFVAGQTLRRWCQAVPQGRVRPWSEVLAVFTAAGWGLSAAHDEGLIHRDFKPDNVMLGDDGRVRVMDFGLARTTEFERDEPDERDERGEQGTPGARERRGWSSPQADLTHTGALLGTPAYMAPEQFLDGATMDARGDQFAYCVTLYEALYGERPHRGASVSELAVAAAQGEWNPPPRGALVPSWLRRVVLRGLSPEPRDRYRSMSELLAELAAGKARRRRRWWLVGAGALGGAVATIVGAYRYDQVQRAAACRAQGDAIDEVWNDAARETLREGLVATGVGYAPTVAERVMPWLDDYAESWRRHTTEACTNATVDHTWGPRELDKARWCLDERRLAFTARVTALGTTDAQGVPRAVQRAAMLPPLVTCVDETSLAAMSDPPVEEIRAQVEQVREALSRAINLEEAGKYEEGLMAARQAQQQAEALGWSPLTAAALRTTAWLLGQHAAYAEAEGLAIQAYMEAVRSDAWEVAATTATHLVHFVGNRQARGPEGKLWAEHAAVAIEKAGDPAGILEANRLNNLGNIHYAMGELTQARARYEQVLSLWQAGVGANSPLVANALNNLGNVHYSMEEYLEAMRLYERALVIRREALGPDHPSVASSFTNLGVTYASVADYEQAKDLYEQALAILERSRGPRHPEVATNLNNLAQAYLVTEQYEVARSLYARAIGIREEVLGADHPSLLNPLSGLGQALVGVGAYEQAVPVLDRALGFEARAGASVGSITEVRMHLAHALWGAPESVGLDRTRARALVEQVRDGAAEASKARAEAERWLRGHAEPAPTEPGEERTGEVGP